MKRLDFWIAAAALAYVLIETARTQYVFMALEKLCLTP